MATPTRLPEITCEPLASPWITASVASSIRTPSSALPRSSVPVISVPIRLSRTRHSHGSRARAGDPYSSQVARDDVAGPDHVLGG